MGADVTVYTTDSSVNRRLDVPVNTPVDINGVRVFFFRADWSLKRFYSRALRSACKNTIGAFDILHIVSFWCYPDIVSCHEARRQHIPYILAPHGTLMSQSMRRKRRKKQLYKRLFTYRNMRNAMAIRYTTELERQQSILDKQVASKTSFVLPNGIECHEFDQLPTRNDAIERLGLPSQSKLITYLGRLHACKQLDLLLLAFAQAIKYIPDSHLILAGPDDGDEAKLRALTKKFSLYDRIHFLGFIGKEDRRNLLAATQLLALVSSAENFGMAAVEAMAAGVPVLVSDRVGVSTEIASDGAGKVVPPRQDAIAQALTELLLNPLLLNQMGKKAQMSALKRYDIRAVAKQMLIAFEDVLTGRRSQDLNWSDN